MNKKNRATLKALNVIIQAVVENLMQLLDEIQDEPVRLEVCTVAASLMTAQRYMSRILQENEEDESNDS